MSFKLKTKVALGGIFLFLLLILVGAISFIYFNRITSEAKDIVKNNYESLNYSREMLNALDRFKQNDSVDAFSLFEKNLSLQGKNITELGEKAETEALASNYKLLQQNKRADSLYSPIRTHISNIMKVNLSAIDKKNHAAQASAQYAKTIISIIVTVCVLMGFTFLFTFPSLIAGPISKLTEAIKGIAEKKYNQRIHLNRNDEFGELANAFNSMAEKLDEYEHSNLSKILFEKQRAETVINSLQDASIGIDNKSIILFANKQALHLLTLKEAEIIGQQSEAIQKKNDLFRFLIKEESNIPFKIVVDGKENYFSREIIDINPDGQKIGNVIILKNITPYKELDAAKTNFIATISHELKTPLASSDFSLKLLEDERIGILSTEQKELVQSLKNDNQRLLRILSELLDMSQVESGKIQLHILPISAYAIILKAKQSVDNALRQKNILIKDEIDTALPAIKADEEKTVWILNNFLTNAIKFSPENSTLLIKAFRKDNYIEIGVIDYGIGIAEKFQSAIFNRYFKVPDSPEKKGTGLGLAISKDFAEAMNGNIGVKSETGKGAYFFFQLPLA